MSEQVPPIKRGRYFHVEAIRYMGKEKTPDGKTERGVYTGVTVNITGLAAQAGAGLRKVEGVRTDRIELVGRSVTNDKSKGKIEQHSTGLYVRAKKEKRGNWLKLRRARWTVEIGDVITRDANQRKIKKPKFEVLESFSDIASFTGLGARMKGISRVKENPHLLVNRGVLFDRTVLRARTSRPLAVARS